MIVTPSMNNSVSVVVYIWSWSTKTIQNVSNSIIRFFVYKIVDISKKTDPDSLKCFIHNPV